MQVLQAPAERTIPIVHAASHNDEMQAVPFSAAISLGIPCVEVDVWLVDGVLFAGHEPKNLSPSKTLQNLYLDPILHMLERANAEKASDEGWRGIFPLAPKQDLSLMIDMKGDGEALYVKLLEVLQPFIAADYLTIYDESGQLKQRPITVIGTGNTPIPFVVRASPRYVFYDAPLSSLAEPFEVDGRKVEWTSDIAPMASSKWLWTSYFPNVAALKRYSDEAHRRGIKCRWWGVLRWPGYLRRGLWNLQLQAEVDWINADDLEDVASFLRSKATPAVIPGGLG